MRRAFLISSCSRWRTRALSRAFSYAFEGDEDGFDDGVDGLAEGFPDLVGVDDDGFGDACDHVAAFDFHRGLLFEGISVADGHLDALGGLLPDGEVVLALHVGDDGLIHLVAADANGLGVDDAGEGDDGDFGDSAADVDGHVAAGLFLTCERRST